MRAILVTLLMIAMALAGCTSDDGGDNGDGQGNEGQGNDGHGSDGHGDPEPGHEDAPERLVNVTADKTNGMVPAEITFLVELIQLNEFNNQTFYDSYGGNYTYTIDFGDETTDAGEGVGGFIDAVHTYELGGNYTVLVSVSFEGGEPIEGSLGIKLTTPAPPRQLPEPSHFEYGPALGCAGDVDTCIGMLLVTSPIAMSPEEADGIDGYWQPLTEEYWGLVMETTVDSVSGDSDCNFFNAAFEIIGAPNNVDQPCGGVVPDETAWLFLYSYAEPNTGQTATFKLP